MHMGPFMLAQYPTQSTLSRSIRRGWNMLAGSMAVAILIIMLFVMIKLEVSAATLRSTETEESSRQIVNRTQKGDRQLARKELRQIKIEPSPPPTHNLADGCEPLVSPLANARFAKVAGRCVS